MTRRERLIQAEQALRTERRIDCALAVHEAVKILDDIAVRCRVEWTESLIAQAREVRPFLDAEDGGT